MSVVKAAVFIVSCLSAIQMADASLCEYVCGIHSQGAIMLVRSDFQSYTRELVEARETAYFREQDLRNEHKIQLAAVIKSGEVRLNATIKSIVQANDENNVKVFQKIDSVLIAIIAKIESFLAAFNAAATLALSGNVVVYEWKWCVLLQLFVCTMIVYLVIAKPLRKRVGCYWFAQCVVSTVFYYLIQLFHDMFTGPTTANVIGIVSYVFAGQLFFATILSSVGVWYTCRIPAAAPVAVVPTSVPVPVVPAAVVSTPVPASVSAPVVPATPVPALSAPIGPKVQPAVTSVKSQPTANKLWVPWHERNN